MGRQGIAGIPFLLYSSVSNTTVAPPLSTGSIVILKSLFSELIALIEVPLIEVTLQMIYVSSPYVHVFIEALCAPLTIIKILWLFILHIVSLTEILFSSVHQRP